MKPAYDELPKIAYPLITIQEIDNSSNERFSDNIGKHEHISNNAYQIDFLSKKRIELNARESAFLMMHTANELLVGPRYKFSRIGNPIFKPLTEDKNIIRYITRYDCSINLDTGTIYKRS